MPTDTSNDPEKRGGAKTASDRRGNVRRATHAVFTARIDGARLMGGGRDISRAGAYFVTSDEIPLEVCFEVNGKETRVRANVIRMDPLSPGTLGIAVQFERRLLESELP